MPIYKGTTELTKIADFIMAAEHDITEVYFGDKQVFTVWGEYDGTLPATYSANGSMLADYHIYGSTGGVGDVTAQLFDPNATNTNNGYIDGKYLGFNNEILNPTIPREWAISEYISCSPNLAYVLKTIGNDTYPSICWYDDNYNFLSGTQYDRKTTLTVSSPANAAYVRFSIYRLNMPKNSLTLSPASESYVPYGYEVDMSVMSANLYDITTQIPVSVNSNKSGYIRVEASTTYTLWHNATDNIQRNLQLCNSNKAVIAEVAITKGVNQFTFNTISNTAYVVIIYPARSTQVMLTKGSTAPSTYIPYSNTTVPIYIGSEPLGEDEYVDHAAGKIYRRTGNLWNGVYEQGGIDFTTGATFASANYVRTELMQCSGMTDIAFTYFAEAEQGAIVFYDGNGDYIREGSTMVISGGDPTFEYHHSVPSGAAYVAISFSAANSSQPISPATAAQVTVVEGSTAPSTYIPYLQPEDPPVPLPALPTVAGVTTADYAGQSAAPSRFYAKYRKEDF